MVGTILTYDDIAVNKTHGAYIPVGILISQASCLLENISASKKYFLSEHQEKQRCLNLRVVY